MRRVAIPTSSALCTHSHCTESKWQFDQITRTSNFSYINAIGFIGKAARTHPTVFIDEQKFVSWQTLLDRNGQVTRSGDDSIQIRVRALNDKSTLCHPSPYRGKLRSEQLHLIDEEPIRGIEFRSIVSTELIEG